MFRHKAEVVARHCELFDRDPAEVKKTVCLPFRIFDTDEEARAKGQPWYCWGTISWIQDYLGAYIEAGAEEIMLCAVPNNPRPGSASTRRFSLSSIDPWNRSKN